MQCYQYNALSLWRFCQVTNVTEVPTFVPAAERLVAIGDLHGDFKKAWRAFRLAGLIDENGRWSGDKSVCVQVC